MVRAWLIPSVLLGLTLAAPSVQAACDEQTLALIAEGVPGAQPNFAATWVATMLAKECPELPTGVRGAFQAYLAASQAERRQLVLRALEQDRALWRAACPGGDALLRAHPGERALPALRRRLRKSCGLVWLGSEEELARGGPALELAVITHRWLVGRGIPPQVAVFVSRVLAGFDPPGADAPDPDETPPPPADAPIKDRIR